MSFRVLHISSVFQGWPFSSPWCPCPFFKFFLQYFEHVEEAEWAVQVLKTTGKPVAATLCIGPEGDLNGVSPGDCAVKLVQAGMMTELLYRRVWAVMSCSLQVKSSTWGAGCWQVWLSSKTDRSDSQSVECRHQFKLHLFGYTQLRWHKNPP